MRFSPIFALALLTACSGTDSADDTDVDTDVAVAAACVDPSTAPPGVICTIAGKAGIAAVGEEGTPAKDSYLYLPMDATVGPDGLLYVIDWNNHRVRRIDADGTLHTVAGTGILGDGPEGNARQASFNHPTSILFNPKNPDELYIAAWHNSRIEKVDMVTSRLTFECGTGGRSYAGDNGQASTSAGTAVLDLPSSLAFEEDGSLYVADSANQIIRHIDLEGIITTVAGEVPVVTATVTDTCALPPCTTRHYGWDGDEGPALSAHFNFGWGQKTDPTARILRDGRSLYITDSYNHVVRRMDLDDMTIHAFAGQGLTPGFAGDGGQAKDATLDYPTDIAVDGQGNVYIADTDNNCVRVVDSAGVISTFAGVCSEFGYAGDGGPANEALLLKPYGVTFDAGNNRLIIADTENQVFRSVNL